MNASINASMNPTAGGSIYTNEPGPGTSTIQPTPPKSAKPSGGDVGGRAGKMRSGRVSGAGNANGSADGNANGTDPNASATGSLGTFQVENNGNVVGTSAGSSTVTPLQRRSSREEILGNLGRNSVLAAGTKGGSSRKHKIIETVIVNYKY
jgi:hypothetical protein